VGRQLLGLEFAGTARVRTVECVVSVGHAKAQHSDDDIVFAR